jgi:hypothetical protein
VTPDDRTPQQAQIDVLRGVADALDVVLGDPSTPPELLPGLRLAQQSVNETAGRIAEGNW